MTNINTIKYPFVGLRAYNSDESDIFFGREKQILILEKKIEKSKFLVVLGAAGSGKTSLINAGLVSKLKKNASNENSLKVIKINYDKNIIDILSEELVNICYKSTEEEKIKNISTNLAVTYLKQHTNPIVDILNEFNFPKSKKVLIIIDNFEKIFYYLNKAEDKNQIKRLVNQLFIVSKQNEIEIYVCIIMHSGFLSECVKIEDLPEIINNGQYLIPNMNLDEIKQTIVKPLKNSGIDISYKLVDELILKQKNNNEQLTEFQNTLLHIWKKWCEADKTDNKITLEYFNEEIKTNIVEYKAEKIYNSLETNEEKKICEIIFKSLTQKIDNNNVISINRSIDKLTLLCNTKRDVLIRIVNKFATNDIPILKYSKKYQFSKDKHITLNHDNTASLWGRLKQWIDDESKLAKIYLNLIKDSDLYQDGKIDFWEGEKLQNALIWYDNNKPIETWAQKYHTDYESAITFLERSQKQHNIKIKLKENFQKHKRVKYFAVIITIIAAIAVLSMTYAFYQKSITTELVENANKNEQLAKKQLILAHNSNATAEKRLADIIELQKNNFKLFEKLQKLLPNNKNITHEFAKAYNDFAWYQILNKQYSEAIILAKKGLEIDPKQESINTNLALAYLMNNEFEKAKEIYLKFKGKPYYKGGTYKDVFFVDLIALEAEGFAHPDIEKAFKILE